MFRSVSAFGSTEQGPGHVPDDVARLVRLLGKLIYPRFGERSVCHAHLLTRTSHTLLTDSEGHSNLIPHLSRLEHGPLVCC